MPEDDSARLLAELDGLRTQAEALSKRLASPVNSQTRYSGGDQRGLARVIVDGRGRATDVVVTREWRRQTDAAGLAAALLHATAEAQARRLAGWAAGGEPSAPPPDTTAAPPAGSALDSSGPDLIRALLPLLDEAERQLDDAQHKLERHFTEQVRQAGPRRELTITSQGGQVTEIEFDDRWIASASADEVARRVCHLLQQAHDRASTGIGDLLPRELGDLVSFAADPERMLRRLGLQT